MEKYQKIRVLGKGSFGVATLVKRVNDGEMLVSKEISLVRMSERERTSARHEVKILSRLSHPNIIRYVEHIEQKNILYIVMEYADGGDLYQLIKRNSRAISPSGVGGGPFKRDGHVAAKANRGPGPSNLSESFIMRLFVQVALAIDYLHYKHVLHRDIKSMNVFLTSKNIVKLGDMGIATLLVNTYAFARTVCGTPYYFAPELCRGKPYNNKVDVYALGVVLYEMAMVRHPFEAPSVAALMNRICRGQYNAPPVARETSPGFSKAFVDLIAHCLDINSTTRYTIKQVVATEIVKNAIDRLESDLLVATQRDVKLQLVPDEKHESPRNVNRPLTPTPAPQQPRAPPAANPVPPARRPVAMNPTPQPKQVQPPPRQAAPIIGQARNAAVSPIPRMANAAPRGIPPPPPKMPAEVLQQQQRRHKEGDDIQRREAQRKEAAAALRRRISEAQAQRYQKEAQLAREKQNEEAAHAHAQVRPGWSPSGARRLGGAVPRQGAVVDPRRPESPRAEAKVAQPNSGVGGYFERRRDEIAGQQKSPQQNGHARPMLREDLPAGVADRRKLFGEPASEPAWPEYAISPPSRDKDGRSRLASPRARKITPARGAPKAAARPQKGDYEKSKQYSPKGEQEAPAISLAKKENQSPQNSSPTVEHKDDFTNTGYERVVLKEQNKLKQELQEFFNAREQRKNHQSSDLAEEPPGFDVKDVPAGEKRLSEISQDLLCEAGPSPPHVPYADEPDLPQINLDGHRNFERPLGRILNEKGITTGAKGKDISSVGNETIFNYVEGPDIIVVDPERERKERGETYRSMLQNLEQLRCRVHNASYSAEDFSGNLNGNGVFNTADFLQDEDADGERCDGDDHNLEAQKDKNKY